jgi:RHS repeat-associated protein
MDATGKVTDTYDYDAFGNVVGSTGSTANVYRYQGEALDAETGLYYLRVRYYDPVVGRFLSVDPMTDEGEHPYTYAGADPVNGHDPTGQQDVLEATFPQDVSMPSAQFFAGMEGSVTCIAGRTFSMLSNPDSMLQSLRSCAFQSTGRRKSKGGDGPGREDPPTTSKRLPDRVKAVSDFVGDDPLAIFNPGTKLRSIAYDAYAGDNLFPRSEGVVIRENLIYSYGQRPAPSKSPAGKPFDDQVSTRARGAFGLTQQFFITVPGTEEYRVQIEPCSGDRQPGKLVWENVINASDPQVLINRDPGSKEGRTCPGRS